MRSILFICLMLSVMAFGKVSASDFDTGAPPGYEQSTYTENKQKNLSVSISAFEATAYQFQALPVVQEKVTATRFQAIRIRESKVCADTRKPTFSAGKAKHRPLSLHSLLTVKPAITSSLTNKPDVTFCNVQPRPGWQATTGIA